MKQLQKWHKLILGLFLSAILAAPAGCGDDPFCIFDAEINWFIAADTTINSGETAFLSWNANFNTDYCDLYATNSYVRDNLLYTGSGDDSFGVTLTETTMFELRCNVYSSPYCPHDAAFVTVTVN